MKIEFEKQSLFEKYNLPVTRDSRKLISLFQTNPSLRKNLPKVIKTITNKENLLVEGLFTTAIDGKEYSLEEYEASPSNDVRNVIAATVLICRNFEQIINNRSISPSLFKQTISNFISIDLQVGESYFGDSFSDVFQDFSLSICDELINSIKRLTKRNESFLTNIIFEYIEVDENVFGEAINSFKEFNEVFASSVCDSIDDFCDQSIEEKDERLDDIQYVFSLKWKILTFSMVYSSFSRFALDRIKTRKNDISQEKLIYLLEILPTLFFTLDKNDRPQLGIALQELVYMAIIPANAYMFSWNSFSRMLNAIETDAECLDSNGSFFTFPKIFRIANKFKEAGEDWYRVYRKYIILVKRGQNVPDSIYNACILLYQMLGNDDLRDLMGAYFSRSFGFDVKMEKVCESYVKTKELIDKCNKEKQCRSFTWFYRNGVISPKELDSFLQNYYGITILMPYFSEACFYAKKSYELIFNYLKDAVKNFNKENEAYYSGSEINFLNSLPDDWRGESSITYGDIYRKYDFVGENEKTAYGCSRSKQFVETVDQTIYKLQRGYKFDFSSGEKENKSEQEQSKKQVEKDDKTKTIKDEKPKETEGKKDSAQNSAFSDGNKKSESENNYIDIEDIPKKYVFSHGCPYCKRGKHKKPKTPIIKSPIHKCFRCSKVYFENRYDEFITLTEKERERYFHNSHQFPLQILVDVLCACCPLLLPLAFIPGLYWMVGVSFVPVFLSIIPGQIRNIRAKNHIYNKVIKESLTRCMDKDYLIALRKNGKQLYPIDYTSSLYNDCCYFEVSKLIEEVNSIKKEELDKYR